MPCAAAAAMLLAGPVTASGLAGQGNPPQGSQQQASPTQPVQPSLTVDRDPVASPDPDISPSHAGEIQAPEGPSGPIHRGAGGKYTLRTDAYEVRLNATVLDSDGKSILTLNKDDFKVFEDGVPQTIASFRHEDLPVSVGILIDSSGSMYDKRAAVEEAALDLIKLSNKEDEAFVVDFSWEAFIDADFTNNIDKLREGLNYVKSSGGTAVYDALVASADYLAKNAKHPKQVLLVVTDGEDNASSATLEQAIRRIQDLDGPVIYSVGLLFGQDTDKRESRHARRVLETLSEQTGGVAYFPKSLKEVNSIAAQVAQDIRTQYTIAYHSTKSPTLGGYRQIRVEAKAKGMGKLSVRTRTGYYPHIASDAAAEGQATSAASQPDEASKRP
ncbi:VWA domain-containing protein [Edaphobacter sp. 12200R-103]|uniref:VWA domain-containing protein n=1 Tax=Edaphobacter sp. 12200R-103 TaxID=2703788 RepID=UPI001EE4595F|nr:VWA domain-containing protein [Edaphobacter sp. 12200R-103]